jgi:hypothetical protein
MCCAFPAAASGNSRTVDTQQAAELKTALAGVDLPAEKRDLVAYAPSYGSALAPLPEREYESLDEVVEALVHVQPPRVEPDAREPHEESGLPPGGDDYAT